MNLRPILVFLLILVLFFESSVAAFPFLFIICLLAYLFLPDRKTLISVFIAGLILDVLKAETIGMTPLIIFVSFLILDSVKKVFEIRDYKIILLILFILSFAYSRIFSYSQNLFVYVLVFGGAGISFAYFSKKKSLW